MRLITLVFDIFLLFCMFVFAYATGRRRKDGTQVIPIAVTFMAITVIVAIFILLNVPNIIGAMTG